MTTLFPCERDVRLKLDEEFIERATAISGGQRVDVEFLTHLLKIGLEDQEALKRYFDEHDEEERARDADFLGNVFDSMVADPNLVAEFQTIRDRCRRLKTERRQRGGKGERVRVTLRLPVEDLLLATYLAIHQVGRCQNPDAYPVGMHIDVLQNPVHRGIARAYIEHVLDEHLEKSMRYLDEHRHICLRTRAPVGPDEIPF